MTSTLQPTHQPARQPAGMRWVTCHRPGIFALANATCAHCDTHGEHIKEWRGPGYGHDWHCLTCRTTDQDGFLAAPTGDLVSYFDNARTLWLLSDDLFDAYVDLDCGYSNELTPAAQQTWADDMAALSERITEHINARA